MYANFTTISNPEHAMLFPQGKYKFVWPKDGPKGNRPRGTFGGFKDILTGKGPDIFVQRNPSVTPITADRWANW